MQPINPCLWFDDQAEEAANFYVSVFDDARIMKVLRYRGDETVEISGKEEGSVLTVHIEVAGQQMTLLNGGPRFTFDEAVSLVVPCDDQDEIDRYWEALTADGGKESQCGWLCDRFGVSWQVIPADLLDLVDDADPEAAGRVLDAIQEMRKLDVAAMRAAAAGSEVGAAG